MMEWIKVADRLPKEGQCVIVSCKDYLYNNSYVMADDVIFEDTRFQIFDEFGYADIDGKYRKVTHWMPYPAPAKN